MKQYYTYILLCADGSFYTGVTSSLENRLVQDKKGLFKKSYTNSRLPVYLVFYETFSYVLEAIAREKQIQGWNRSKKLALIFEDYHLLKMLTRYS